MKKTRRRDIFYITVIVILLVVIAVLLFRAYSHYSDFKSHRQYLKQPNPRIESWMTLGFVIGQFHITPNVLLRELNISNQLVDNRLTIDKVCKNNHLNCTEVVNRFNNLSQRPQ